MADGGDDQRSDLQRELGRIWSCGAPMSASQQASVLELLERSPLRMRFEDEALQAALIVELKRVRVKHGVDDEGSVVYGKDEWLDVGDAINRVRDSQFRWYLVFADTTDRASMWRTALVSAGLPFVVEHHRDGIAFLIRRDDQERHRELGVLGGSDG